MVNTAPQSDSARYRQLGNAVCVSVAEWIGRRIMEAAGVTLAHTQSATIDSDTQDAPHASRVASAKAPGPGRPKQEVRRG